MSIVKVLFIAVGMWNIRHAAVPHVSMPPNSHFSTMSKWVWDWPGPEGGAPTSVVADPSNPSHAIAQTDYLLWEYNGTSWSLDQAMMDIGSPVRIIALGNDEFGVFAIGRETGGTDIIFLKKSWGGSWNEIRSFANFLCVAEAAGSVNYVVTADTIFKTTDGGDTWTAVHTTPLFSTENMLNLDIDFSPANAQTVYLAVSYHDPLETVLFKSTDGGASWDTVYVDSSTSQGFLPTMKEIEVKSDDPDFVVIVGGLFNGPSMIKYSTDGGNSFNIWLETLALGLVSAEDVEFIGDTVYISNMLPSKLVKGSKFMGFWRFETLDTLRMYGDIFLVGNTAYATYSAGIVSVAPSGDITDVSDGLKAVEILGRILGAEGAFAFPQHGVMSDGTMALTDLPFYLTVGEFETKPSNAIYITHDGGNTWEKKFIPSVIVFNAVNAPNNPNYLYVGGVGLELIPPDSMALYTLFRSTDGGNSFEPLQMASDSGEVSPMIVRWVSPSDPNVIIATQFATDSVSLMRSTDGGHTFATVLTIHDQPIALTGTDTLFLVHGDNLISVEVSYDGGATWSNFTTINGFVGDAEYVARQRQLYLICASATGFEIRAYTLDGNYQSITPPMIAAYPVDMSVDSRGRIFMAYYAQPISIIARYDGSSWDADTTSINFVSEVLASDTAVVSLTLFTSGFRSREAAFAVEEPPMPIETPSRAPEVGYSHGILTVGLQMPARGAITLTVFDVSGRTVASFRKEATSEGTVRFPVPEKLSSGVYLYELKCSSGTYRGNFIVIN